MLSNLFSILRRKILVCSPLPVPRLPFRGEPQVVDLTGVAHHGGRLLLASGVHEARIECLAQEREALLYYLLVRYVARAACLRW